MVTDTSLLLYWRLFSWYRLLRVWVTLRFDDHRGLLPDTLRMVSGSVRGTLVRTKTSGAGKRREELYLHIDALAYISQPTWHKVGMELWPSVNSPRDYFLMLPSYNFHGVVALEAQYADCQALCNRLHKSILHQDGSPVLPMPDCEAFWTQHGDRATLPTLGAVDSSLPVEWLDELGHWSSKSSHACVRTQLQKVAKIQSAIAGSLRAGCFYCCGDWRSRSVCLLGCVHG